MWDTLTGLAGLLFHSLLTLWLASALFWAVAGAAIASWGRLPVLIGVATGLVPVLGGAVLAVMAGARRGADMAPQLSRLGDPSGGPAIPPGSGPGFGHGTAPGWGGGAVQGWGSAGHGWSAGPAAGQLPGSAPSAASGGPGQGAGWPGQGPGWSGQPGAPGGSGQPGSAGPWSQSPGGHGAAPSSPPRRNGISVLAILLGVVGGLVVIGFAATLFLSWLTPSSGPVGAFDVGLGVPLIVTCLVGVLCAAVVWRAPRRWAAVLAAWFAAWWFVIGMVAVTNPDDLAAVFGDSADVAVQADVLGAALPVVLTTSIGGLLVAGGLVYAAGLSTERWTRGVR
ncbi:hypothetical protein [Nakamurella alba]|uniref:hypothetical protein n=1 Tax=Nakamurella alba TaxID=2665158 RepID=UPI0018AA1FB8|nr:hypothetical protein [Nakamurella alba]